MGCLSWLCVWHPTITNAKIEAAKNLYERGYFSCRNPQDSDNTVKDMSKRKFFKSGAAVAGAPVRELTQEQKPPNQKSVGASQR